MAETIKKANGRGAALLDAAMAAFAAGAVGFASFVMPAGVVAGIVVPGGQAGRAAASLVAAFATFLGVVLLLRALSGPVRRRARGSLRLRRADMHPDAPARSPILAARDLGVPLDELVLDAHTAEAIDLEAADAEPEHAADGHEAPDADISETAEDVPKHGLPFWILDDAPPDEVEAGAPMAEEVVAQVATPPPMPFWVEDPSVLPSHVDELGAHLPRPADGEPASRVERLETGVLRCKLGGRAAAEAAEREQERALEERLRGAISDLRKMARG